MSSLKDFEIRKTLALSAYHKMWKIWSSIQRKLKVQANVESVLLYGAETWTIDSKLLKN